MIFHPVSKALPQIFVGEREERRLFTLATAAELTQRSRDVAQRLLRELARASVVPEGEVPANVVRMNSRVEFVLDDTDRRCVEIVYPREADIDAGKISILTPVGAALIGLSPGQMMMLEGNDGRPHKLRVISVVHPVTSS
ncbi:nucleoside diphosphate kinase regulator [Hyphomicrobium sp. DMF-1]|uniref:nucleoside diphosphate kinase regulator n=1 Tax=Hyphomicrobium sp. DMF-1 TaxID=3019544 RepID=UPI0022EBCB52|nr:nucleoside diphosphate kinase regulator [Hyphomicrobium sp. DMF-1]WBT37715.1 nucleoside diphosphate kinase regulator [Hyphomicrobium sp. DMF-1]